MLDKHTSLFDEETSRRQAYRLVVKLSENCGILPASVNIIGVTDCGKEAISGGGLADIFQATYKGTRVALKRLRDFQVHQQRQKHHRVGVQWPLQWLILMISRNSAEKHFCGETSIILTFSLFTELTSKRSYPGCAWYLPGCPMGLLWNISKLLVVLAVPTLRDTSVLIWNFFHPLI